MVERAKLTKTLVEAVKPADQDLYLWDSGLKGFGLKVTPKGARIYLVQYRPKSSRLNRRYTLGRHGSPLTTEKARDAASGLLARVRLGEDPYLDDKNRRDSELAAKVAHEEAEERAAAEVFTLVVEQFIERYAKPKNRSWWETERILNSKDLAPWRSRAVSTLSRREIAALIDQVSERSNSSARLLFAALRRMFNWCVERQILESSPCTGLKSPPAVRARDRILSDNELGIVWVATGKLRYPYGHLIRLMVLTAQRRDEVAGMRWAEIDLAQRQWVVPAERAKNAKAHAVDLSEPAVAILTELKAKRMKGPGDLVFPTSKRTPASNFGKIKRQLDELARLEGLEEGRLAMSRLPWRLHDLRRTAATGMARLGNPPHVIEAVLNHISGSRGGLVAVYQHYDHRGERKAALLGWAAHVNNLVGEMKPISD